MAAPVSTPDDVERLFRRLVANLAALDPSRLSRPFPVGDITRSLVPYRTHRIALRFETSEDYEMAVLRLVAGEGGFAMTDPPDAAEAALSEIQSPNPDPGILKQIATATVSLDPERVADALTGRTAPAAPPAVSVPDDEPVRGENASVVSIFTRTSEPVVEPPEPDDDDPPFTLAEPGDDEEGPSIAPRAVGHGAGCPYCGGELPVGRTVLFCPHCGQNVGVVHCPTCGSELDVGWQFCITCGQKVSGGL